MNISKRQREIIKSHFSATHVRVHEDGSISYAPSGVTSNRMGWDWRRGLRPDGEPWTLTGLLAHLGDPSCEVIVIATGRRITQELYHTVAAADREAARLNDLLGAMLCVGRRIGSAEGSV